MCASTITSAVLVWVAACGAGSSHDAWSPSAVPSGDTVQITGRERLEWIQAADTVDNLRFAVYVDNTRVDLREATCRATQIGWFECDAPPPPLSRGPHVLELVAWTIAGAGVVESPRSAPVRVIVMASP